MRQLKITRQITCREEASLDKYLQEIAREKLITPEEEATLAQKVKEGDESAIEKLTKANLRFVVSVAKQYQHYGLPLTDLINEGNIGLIKAAKKFDSTLGFKLITYAVWWIRQSIMHAIDEQSNLVRLPSNQLSMIKKVRNTAIRMEQQFHREPSYEEVGNEISLSAEAISDIMSTSTRQVSLDAPCHEGEDLTLKDMIEDKDGENSDQKQFNTSLKRELENMVATLPSEEANIIRLYFGMDGRKPMTLEEIGAQYGCARDRIRNIKEKALSKLRHTKRSKVLKEYFG